MLLRPAIIKTIQRQTSMLILRGRCFASLGTKNILKLPNYPSTLQICPLYQANHIRLCHDEGCLTEAAYIEACDETLESLGEWFEELVEQSPQFAEGDVNLGDGVLTVKLGPSYGTYVINRQRPNLQVWLSSPTSGPKRYDLVQGRWVYKHDGVPLHKLLEQEFSAILDQPVDLSSCAYYGHKD